MQATKIPSDIKYVRKTSTEVERFLKSRNVDDSYVFDIRLCTEEAIKNAIIHGNKKNKKLSVSVSYSLEGDKFTMEVEDEGSGFIADKLPDPTKDENLFMTGGRGVFIIRKLMDRVEYNSKGNKTLMEKSVKYKKGGNNAG